MKKNEKRITIKKDIENKNIGAIQAFKSIPSPGLSFISQILRLFSVPPLDLFPELPDRLFYHLSLMGKK